MPGSSGSPLIRGGDDFVKHFPVSRETRVKLETYARLLMQWQQTINLVAPSTLPDVWDRHFADSAQLLWHAPPGAARWLDLGSGAGFPGLVLAILHSDPQFRVGGRLAEGDSPLDAPSHRVGGRLAEGESPTPLKDSPAHTLIESDTRKAAFLREVARQTGTAVDILARRIELTATHAKVGTMDVITARALAPLGRLLDLSAPFFSSRTRALFLKGQEVAAEIDEARLRWAFDVRLEPSLTNPLGRVAVVEHLHERSEA